MKWNHGQVFKKTVMCYIMWNIFETFASHCCTYEYFEIVHMQKKLGRKLHNVEYEVK